jgi:AcrR family transcriptional regulator
MVAREAMHERVVAGALAAVTQHGWSGATLARIASAAGTSRMTLHRHGLGRDEIFQLLARSYERDFRAALSAAVAEPGTPPERLRRGLASVCEVSERHLAFLRGLDEEADTRLFHVGGVSRAGFVGPIERVLREGMRDGSLRRLPVRRTATLLVNAADRTYRHMRIAHGWSAERSREPIDLLVRGISAGS